MRTLRRLTLGGFLFTLVWAGCDAVGPAEPGGDAAQRAGAAIHGSVFVNDGDDKGTAREPGELGIENVRVDVFAPFASTPTASALTGPDGRFEVDVPAGHWVVRLSPDPSPGAFNPTLFSFYGPADGVTERIVRVAPRAHHVEFGFDPKLREILTEVAHGDAQTEGQPGSRWLEWLRLLEEGHRCVQAAHGRICRSHVDTGLDAIFADGTPADAYFGNAEPYVLPPEADPLAEAIRILASAPSTDLGRIRVELFIAEINYHAGLGSDDPVFDRTLLYYFEEYLVLNESMSPRLARDKAASVELNVLRAYNRGGGGGDVRD